MMDNDGCVGRPAAVAGSFFGSMTLVRREDDLLVAKSPRGGLTGIPRNAPRRQRSFQGFQWTLQGDWWSGLTQGQSVSWMLSFTGADRRYLCKVVATRCAVVLDMEV